MANSTQMLKGLLEGCILKIVSNGETYGYEVCEKLINYGFEDISEGSVYPILIRLEKKKLNENNLCLYKHIIAYIKATDLTMYEQEEILHFYPLGFNAQGEFLF